MEELETLLEKEESMVATEPNADTADAVMAQLAEAVDEIPGDVEAASPMETDDMDLPSNDAVPLVEAETSLEEEPQPETLEEIQSTTASGFASPTARTQRTGRSAPRPQSKWTNACVRPTSR